MAWWKRFAIVSGMTIAIFVVAVLMNAAITDKRSYAWFHTTAIYDVAGTLCHDEPLSDDEMRAELTGIALRNKQDLYKAMCTAYNAVNWIPLVYGADPPFTEAADETERDARRAAYFRVIHDHPAAYVRHRVEVMKLNLGLMGFTPEQPVIDTVAGTPAQAVTLHLGTQTSKFQRVLTKKLTKIAYENKYLWRPWVYVLLGLAMFGYAAVRRDGFIAGILTSGFLYEACYTVAAPGAGYRYQHWMIVCVVLAMMIAFVDRWREGRAALARA